MQPRTVKTPARPLQIDVRQVISRVHQNYANVLAEAMNENAELFVSLETAQARIAELEAQVEAMRGARASTVVSTGPGGTS
jgi:hypothetical protein